MRSWSIAFRCLRRTATVASSSAMGLLSFRLTVVVLSGRRSGGGWGEGESELDGG